MSEMEGVSGEKGASGETGRARIDDLHRAESPLQHGSSNPADVVAGGD